MVIEAKNSAGIRRFSYNSRHQQTRVETETGNVQENRYDAEGLRFELLENGRRTSFVYHDGELLQEEGREEQGTSYHLGAGMEAFRRGQELSYYHRDEQLSTTFITGGHGDVQNSYQYDAFGIPLETTEQLNNRIRYTGQQYDELTEQYYLRARYYNPVAGRFMQEDVYQGDGLNLYAYCGNNPVVYDDPSGYASTSTGKACPPQGKISESVDESGSSSSKGSNYSDTHEILGPYYDEILEKHKTNPEFYAHPDDYKITEGIEYTNNRAEYTRMVKNGEIEPGHHKLGIADGGKNIQSNITYTGEKLINRKLLPKDALEYYDSVYGTKSNPHPKRIAIFEENGIVQFGKNPKHTEATTLQQKIHIWQKEKGIRK